MRPGRGRLAGGPVPSQTRTSIDWPIVRVVVVGPWGESREALLEMRPLLVGSDPGCDLAVDDPRVSRRHCEVRLGEKGVVVRDLGSKNGTLLDGVALVEAIVAPGIELRLGASRLSLRVEEGHRTIALSAGMRFGDAVGNSVVMRALFAQLEVAARSDETVLLLGERGTGKKLLARAIAAHSPRSGGPFVVMDCSAVAPQLIESELFGFVEGSLPAATTGRAGLLEQANGGTLLIDDIGELPLALQPKLLRALEARVVRRAGADDDRNIDVRVIAATHRDLRARVAAGELRRDLYERLAAVEAKVPPLRERRDDIPLLVEQALAEQHPARSWSDLPASSLELLTAHGWPGNVSELRNVVSRLLVLPSALDSVNPGAAGAQAGGASAAGVEAAGVEAAGVEAAGVEVPSGAMVSTVARLPL